MITNNGVHSKEMIIFIPRNQSRTTKEDLGKEENTTGDIKFELQLLNFALVKPQQPQSIYPLSNRQETSTFEETLVNDNFYTKE